MSQATLSTVEAKYHEHYAQSHKLFETAEATFPDGVTHDARHFQPFPIYVQRAQGSHKWTIEGHELVDLWVGHGSLLLGHCHPAVVDAVQQQVAKATHPGGCHELEIEWGQWVKKLIRSAERLRFTSSGTEATLMALRLSRIFTGRNKVLKFTGHFHGWHDALVPGNEAPFDSFDVPGVTPGVMEDLVIVPPNDLQVLEETLDKQNPACVILEATGSHLGVAPIQGDFLRGVRKLTAERDIILIFDEVISGFRVHQGGAQGHYEITPDLTTMAKILAGGLPGGCVAGREDILECISFKNTSGKKMKHPGTFNANPLSAAAGSATLEIGSSGDPNRKANETAATIRGRLNRLFENEGVNWIAYGEFSGIKILPEYDGPRSSSDDFIPCNGQYDQLDRKFDAGLSRAFRCALLLHGVDMGGWRAMTSCEHTADDIEHVIDAFSGTIRMLREDGFLN